MPLPPQRIVPNQKKQKSPAWMGAALILAAFGLIYMVWNSDQIAGKTEQASMSKKERSKIDLVVNKHLIMTNKKIELEQERARLEHLTDTPSVGDQILPRNKPNALYGVDHSSDRNELNAVRDLERPPELNISSPDAVIQSELADTAAIAESERRYRDEYARQFIANAKAAGYAIELDDNFVVKKVMKIKPQGRTLFDRGGGSAAH
jgi:hypothetical protein